MFYPIATAYVTNPEPAVPAVPAAPAPKQKRPASNQYVYKPNYSEPKVSVWQGRTKKEVEEDNMRIAAQEGAYDKRKVVPTGLKPDQMCWVVEVDGSHTLR